jgi:hypothetical protein
MAGVLVLLVPPIIATTLIVRWVDLEPYKQSAFGRYLRTYMTPFAVMVRLLGTVVTHLGAWYRRPSLSALGLAIILLARLRGILWPGSREEREQALNVTSKEKQKGRQT